MMTAAGPGAPLIASDNPVEVLGLPGAAGCSLRLAGIETVGQLLDLRVGQVAAARFLASVSEADVVALVRMLRRHYRGLPGVGVGAREFMPIAVEPALR